ncbi:hypothetical protein DXG01_001270 [Tephrocybe rancida]|nr:hypothetical protein DXG01_001270 [Tephrocybe rancida]
MSTPKYTAEQLTNIAKKLSSKISNDLNQYGEEFSKDNPASKERGFFQERFTDLQSIASKVVAITGFGDVILGDEPFREKMFLLSQYTNDLKSDYERSQMEWNYGDAHSAVFRYIKQFKEIRRSEAEKASKAAAEKAAAEKEVSSTLPGKRPTRVKRIPKKSVAVIIDSDGEDSKMTGVEFLPKCKYCAEKHVYTECPGQAGLRETIADAYRRFDKLIPHTPAVIMHNMPADAVLFDAQRELIERVKGMCLIYDFLTAQRAGLRKRSATAEHEDASSTKISKVVDEDTEMAEEEWNTTNIIAPSTTDCLDLLRLLQPLLNASIDALSSGNRHETIFDPARQDLSTHFVCAHLRVISMINAIEIMFCSHCQGPVHLPGDPCFVIPQGLAPPASVPGPSAAPLQQPSYLRSDVQMADPPHVHAFNPDGTFAMSFGRLPSPAPAQSAEDMASVAARLPPLTVPAVTREFRPEESSSPKRIKRESLPPVLES